MTLECVFRLQDTLPAWCERTAASVGKHYGKIAILKTALFCFVGKYLVIETNKNVQH